MKDERRIHPRIPVNPEFVPVVQGDGFYVQDLSSSGLFLRTADKHRVGSILRLRFSVLVDDVFVFDVKARVARTTQSHPAGMGVEFVDLEPETKQRLEKVLRLSGLRHSWEEGAEVTRQDWDAAQKALRPSSASAVEFGGAVPAQKRAELVKPGALSDADEDEVTRIFHYDGPEEKSPN